MTIDLQSIFGDSAAPAASTPTRPAAAPTAAESPDAPPPEPAPAAAPADLDGLDLDAGNLDADGWPAGAFEPQPCPTCPGLLTWQDAGGRWRCDRCDGDALARSMRWADAAARARQRYFTRKHPQNKPTRS